MSTLLISVHFYFMPAIFINKNQSPKSYGARAACAIAFWALVFFT